METNSAVKISITVVIPNYNHAVYLSIALESVVSQSRQPDAIVVIDDASTDNSVEIILSFVRRHAHIHVIQKSKNCGVFANLNEILPQIKTTHILFLAADDYLCPGCIERAQAILSKYPNAGFCMADYVELSPDGKQKRFRYTNADAPRYFTTAEVTQAIRGRGIVGQGIFQSEGLRQAGGFPESLCWHTDHFICWVLAVRHGLCYVPEAGSVFRLLPNSFSAAGMRGPGQRQVFENFLIQLQRPEYADIKQGLRDGHLLAIFSDIIWRTSWKRDDLRYFLTPSFMATLVWQRLRRIIRHPIPRPVKQFFRHRR